jgi:hypothetical protein
VKFGGNDAGYRCRDTECIALMINIRANQGQSRNITQMLGLNIEREVLSLGLYFPEIKSRYQWEFYYRGSIFVIWFRPTLSRRFLGTFEIAIEEVGRQNYRAEI